MILNPRRPSQPVLLFLLICLNLLGGCSSVSYYYQAAKGQMEIWHQSRPIATLLEEAPEDSELARRLRLVQEILQFAHQELALPDNGSYRHYADLKRPYVVWNLFAAPELSLEPKQWCYPLLGCLGYRGYFSAEKAQAEARKLQQQGWETFVGGILAYSTLGWFDDPVLNTFWALDDVGLAALLFHELAHAVAFVGDDTSFNESFATAVELHGVEQWLAHRAPSASGHARIQSLRERFERRQQIFAMVADIAEQLRQLYASDLSDAVKREGKQRLFRQLQERYRQLRQDWGEDSGFDAWFAAPMTNAKLLTLTSYYDAVPAFLEKIRQLDGDLPAFYRWVRQLAEKPKPERDRILERLARPQERTMDLSPAS